MAAVMTYTSLVSDVQDYLDRTNTSLIAQIPNFITLAEIRCARECKILGLKTSVSSLMSPGTYVYPKPNRLLEVISINFGTSTLYTSVSRQSTAGTKVIVLSAAHNFVVGSPVSVFNMANSAYNGDFTVTAVTQFSFTYVSGVDTEGLTADTGGTITPPLEQRTPLLPRAIEYCNDYWPDRTQKSTPKFYADYDYTNWLIVPTPTIAMPFEVIYYQRPDPLSSTNQQNWFTQYARDMLLYATLLEATPYLKNDSRIETWRNFYMESVSALKKEGVERINDGAMQRQEAQ